MNNGLFGLPKRYVQSVYDPDIAPLNPSPLNDEFEVDFPSQNAAPPGWTNVGVLTPTCAISKGALSVTCTGSVTNNTCGIERGVLPSGPFTIVAKITSLSVNRYNTTGIYVRSSASGRFVVSGQYTRNFGAPYDLATMFERWNNFSSRNSSGNEWLLYGGRPNYWRMVYDGTDLYGHFSPDGINWILQYQEAVTVWFTAGQLPDRFGVKITPFEAVTGTTVFHFIRYSPVPFADLGRTIIREV